VAVQTAKAHWVSRETISWIGAQPSDTYRLYYSLTGEITAQSSDGAFVPLFVDRNGLPQLIVDKFPFLKGAIALKISEGYFAQIPDFLKEGWDFGEVASKALGQNATQANMAGTGIGTFSDRGRDAIRGGRALNRGQTLVAEQGFINGLWYDKNDSASGTLQQLVILDRQERKLDPETKSVVVLFNADKMLKTIDLPDYVGVPLELHPVLRQSSADLVVRQARYDQATGSFIIPPRTTAVFVERR
jgi:hypothetical protein